MDRQLCPYTLKDYDYHNWDSLYLRYMGCRDLTEYTFATTFLCDWHHWELLTNCEWFKPYVERWRKELELSIRSEALTKLLKESQKDTREGLSAARFILEKGYQPKDTKGRPSKHDIAEEAHRLASEEKETQEHITRLGLLPDDLRSK